MALQVTTAATGVVRDAHYVTPTGASAAVRTLLLEPQRTNLCVRSQEFDNASWTKFNASVTANVAISPDGTATADLITSTTAFGFAQIAVTFTGDGTKCAAVFLKAGAAAISQISLRDLTAAVVRHEINVTWTAGVPSLATSSGAGSLYPVEAYGNGWYRVMFSADSIVAANSNAFRVTGANSLNGTVLAWGAQAEDAVVPSSYIPTVATTVTRNADSLYWALASLVPREMTVYARSVNLGWASDTGGPALIFHIGTSGTFTDPRLQATKTSVAGRYASTYDDGVTPNSAIVNTTAATLFDVVEIRLVLTATFAQTLGYSVNAAAELTGAVAASGPAAAFAAARFYLFGATESLQPIAFTNVAIALGTKTRAEMRSIAGV
jgi:hypothetical protein